MTSVRYRSDIWIMKHIPYFLLNVFNPWHVGTELIWFHIANIIIADALAPCIARTLAPMISTIDYASVGPCLTWGRISTTCVMSMWKNDIKCKYMFMLPLNNVAHKGLSKLSQHHCSWCLAPCVARPSATMALTTEDKRLLVLDEARLQLPITSLSWEMT